MSIEYDLGRIAQQEQVLQFSQFDQNSAWELGSRLRSKAESRGQALAIEIEMNGVTVFSCLMAGATANNQSWIRRKRNVVQRFYQSSYRVGLSLQQKQTSLTETLGVALADYAPHGGCFPLLIKGVGCIGNIAVSGLPQREDHNLVVEVLAEWLSVDLASIALE